MQHLVHRDRERVFVPQHGLGEGIPDQHHFDASLIDQTRSGVVVGGKASYGIVTEFLLAKRGGSYLMAGSVKETAADWGQAHDVLQCPSGEPDRACARIVASAALDDAEHILAGKKPGVDVLNSRGYAHASGRKHSLIR